MAHQILVIDDSPVVRRFHAGILKQAGIRSDTANDGMEALEKSLQNAYDLILCDVNMPIMDGMTFIERYRSQGGEAPVIILTTQEEGGNRRRGFEAGANLYFMKPVKPESLILHIRILLGDTPS